MAAPNHSCAVLDLETKENIYGSRLAPAKSLAVYVHFPWCLRKCHYCDFYSIGLDSISESSGPSSRELDSYFKALSSEWRQRLCFSDDCKQANFHKFSQVSSIYFGGGTPSLMPPEMLSNIIQMVSEDFHLSSDCEITLEGNPEDLYPEYLSALSVIGINRLSVGLQSFQAEVLEKMNRFYHRERYHAILDDVKQCPIKDVSFDLVYGFPGQSKAHFYQDLEKVLSFSPKHLSLYSLSVEAATAYGQAVHKKKIPAPNEDLQFEIWQELGKYFLKTANMIHYEVSNYALASSSVSRHNLGYWLYEPYLGLGPGAHGFDACLRYANPRNLRQWLKEPAGAAYIPHEPAIDMPLMFLRLCAPWPLALAKDVFLKNAGLGLEAWERFLQECLQVWVAKGWGSFCMQGGQECFQWGAKGLTFLDDRVSEMCRVLAEKQTKTRIVPE